MKILSHGAVARPPSFVSNVRPGGRAQRLQRRPAAVSGDHVTKSAFWMPDEPAPVAVLYTSERFSTANVAAVRNDARSLEVTAHHLSGDDRALKIFVLAQLVKRYPIFTQGQKTRVDAMLRDGLQDPQLAMRTFFRLVAVTKAPRARATARAVRFAGATLPQACQGFEAADYAALHEQIARDLKITPAVPSAVAADLRTLAAICNLASRPRSQDTLRAANL